MDSNSDKCFPSSRSLGRTQGTPTYFVAEKTRRVCVSIQRKLNEDHTLIIYPI